MMVGTHYRLICLTCVVCTIVSLPFRVLTAEVSIHFHVRSLYVRDRIPARTDNVSECQMTTVSTLCSAAFCCADDHAPCPYKGHGRLQVLFFRTRCTYTCAMTVKQKYNKIARDSQITNLFIRTSFILLC